VCLQQLLGSEQLGPPVSRLPCLQDHTCVGEGPDAIGEQLAGPGEITDTGRKPGADHGRGGSGIGALLASQRARGAIGRLQHLVSLDTCRGTGERHTRAEEIRVHARDGHSQ